MWHSVAQGGALAIREMRVLRLSGLFVSHLDVYQRGLSLKWCERYSIETPLQGPGYVEQLPLSVCEDLDHQLSLTLLLQKARPLYSAEPIRSVPGFFEHITR